MAEDDGDSRGQWCLLGRNPCGPHASLRERRRSTMVMASSSSHRWRRRRPGVPVHRPSARPFRFRLPVWLSAAETPVLRQAVVRAPTGGRSWVNRRDQERARARSRARRARDLRRSERGVPVHRISPRPFLQFPASVARRFCHEITALQRLTGTRASTPSPRFPSTRATPMLCPPTMPISPFSAPLPKS